MMTAIHLCFHFSSLRELQACALNRCVNHTVACGLPFPPLVSCASRNRTVRRSVTHFTDEEAKARHPSATTRGLHRSWEHCSPNLSPEFTELVPKAQRWYPWSCKVGIGGLRPCSMVGTCRAESPPNTHGRTYTVGSGKPRLNPACATHQLCGL